MAWECPKEIPCAFRGACDSPFDVWDPLKASFSTTVQNLPYGLYS